MCAHCAYTICNNADPNSNGPHSAHIAVTFYIVCVCCTEPHGTILMVLQGAKSHARTTDDIGHALLHFPRFVASRMRRVCMIYTCDGILYYMICGMRHLLCILCAYHNCRVCVGACHGGTGTKMIDEHMFYKLVQIHHPSSTTL